MGEKLLCMTFGVGNLEEGLDRLVHLGMKIMENSDLVDGKIFPSEEARRISKSALKIRTDILEGIEVLFLLKEMESKLGRTVAKDCFEGLNRSKYGHFSRQTELSFQKEIIEYMGKFLEYKGMVWNQKPVKRSSFNYRPGGYTQA